MSVLTETLACQKYIRNYHINMELPAGMELSLSFFSPGASDSLKDGHLHCKTVPCCIFAQVLKGRYEIRCGGRFERIDRGEAFLTPPSSPMEIMHRSLSKRRRVMSARWIHFDFSTIGGMEAPSLLEMPLRVSAKEAGPIGALVASALKLKETQGNSFALEARRQEIAFGILRRICALCKLREGALDALRDSRLAAICDAIRREPWKAHSVSSLAKAASLSEPRLHSYLRERMGVTPMGLVRGIRMRLAAAELLEGELKLEALASKFGFANQFHFSRVFKSVYGEAPSEYRRRRFGVTQ